MRLGQAWVPVGGHQICICRDASSKQPDFKRVWSSNLLDWCALLGLQIYLMCCCLTGCPQVSSRCLHNHITSVLHAFLLERRTDPMHGSALNPGKQDLGLQCYLLFSKLFFCSFWISGHSWYLGLSESWMGDSTVSNLRENKGWHFIFSKSSVSNLIFF